MHAPSAGGSSTRRPINALTLLMSLALLLAACSDSSADSATTEPAADGATTAAIASSDDAGPTPLDLQGHRGAHGLRPENTLPGFEAALDLEVTTLELDMHLSADGIVVVWHDPTIDPTKCGLDPGAATNPPDPNDAATPAEDLMLANLTAAEIAGYRCDRNPDPGRFPDQRATPGDVAGDDFSIPTLDDVFRFVTEYAASDLKTETQRNNARSVQFNIETKRDPSDPTTIGDGFDGETAGPFEIEVLAAIDRAGVAGRTVIQSFDHRSLWAIHDLDPALQLAALTSRNDIPDFVALAQAGATIWSPDRRSVGPNTLEDARSAGLAVIPWTVNDPAEMEDLIELGVDGIITDRPDLVPTTS